MQLMTVRQICDTYHHPYGRVKAMIKKLDLTPADRVDRIRRYDEDQVLRIVMACNEAKERIALG